MDGQKDGHNLIDLTWFLVHFLHTDNKENSMMKDIKYYSVQEYEFFVWKMILSQRDYVFHGALEISFKKKKQTLFCPSAKLEIEYQNGRK